MLRSYLLGGLVLTWEDVPLPPIPGTAARSLFAYLLTYHHRPHTRNLLAGTFWPDLPESTARRRLSKALWQIRRALRPLSGDQAQLQEKANGSLDAPQHLPASAVPEFLTSEGDTVQITPDLSLWLDIEEFTRLSVACVGGGAGTIQACERCLALYRGEFLSGYYDDWVIVERERLREVLLEVLERLLEGYKVRAEYERALAVARRLATEDPWRETVHREVMRLLHLLGRDAEALKQFEISRQVLAEDLGIEPSPETTALATEIASRVEVVERPVLPEAAQPVAASLLEHPDRLPLVGRRQELAELLRQLEAAAAGTGGLVIVYGEAGVGKSRLLREFAANAEWRGVPTAWGRCYALTAPLAYQPLVEVLSARLPSLRESALEPLWRAVLSRLLPELAPEEGMFPPLAPEQEQRRLLAAFTQGLLALANQAPHLVLVEDAHWMDPASLGVLRYLLPTLSQASVLVVLTVRGEELAQPVAEGLTTLESTRLARRLVLPRFDQVETEELIQRALNLERPPSLFSARLHAETDGNPFFLIETLRMLVDDGLLFRDRAGAWSTPWDDSTRDYAELPLPASVVQSIERRFDHLAEPLNRVMSLAAIIGQDVGFRLWQAASGWDEETLLAAGDSLCARGLLLAAGADHVGADYVFSHDLIRRLAYERLAPPRRRLYHRRVADALADLAPDQLGTLAHHWTEAQEWDQAADSHYLAGNQARAVYANAEAVAHYSQALTALERRPGPVDLERRCKVHLAREAIYDLLGEREAQAEDLAALKELAEQLSDDELQAAKQWTELSLRQAKYARKTGDYSAAITGAQAAIQFSQVTGDVHSRATGHLLWGIALELQGKYRIAQERYRQVMILAQQVEARQIEADSLRNLGNVCMQTSDYARGRNYYEQALHIYHEIGDRLGEGGTLNNLGIACSYQGDMAGAEATFEQALCIKRELGDRWGENGALTNLGYVAWNQGDYAKASGFYQQALAISREIGDRQRASIALSNLARIFHHLGNDEDAHEYGQRSLSIARELGYRYVEGHALTYLGHALAGLGQLAEAADVYREAITLRRRLGQHNLAMESQAGLARVCLAQGDLSQAQGLVDEILAHLENAGPDGMVEPFQAYLTCYHVLRANDTPRASEVLATAYDLLQEQATRISDTGTRHLFLESVVAHCEIVTAYEELQAGQQGEQIRVALPRAGAPLGRPLRDDEYVTVTWTVAAPQDTEPHKVTRRRQRVLRLLRQAQAQGAVPTYAHLAEALGVSQRTVERDMAALSREFPDLPPTRGKMSA